ncbi:hypothetical protein WA016_02374 [Myxococcus stipitatus]
MKCGALLPPVGDCPACAKAAAQTTLPGLPSFLDRDLQIDRRTPGRAEGPAFAERSPAPPPAVAPLAGPLPPPAEPRVTTPRNAPGVARPTPPGMTPAARPASGQPAWAQQTAQPQGGGGFPLNVPPPPATVQPSMSPMTPAYGTPSAARARAAGLAAASVGQDSANSAAETLPGMPLIEPVAPVSSGLPRMGPSASGQPHGAASAQPHRAASGQAGQPHGTPQGLPHMAASAQAHTVASAQGHGTASGQPHAATSAQPHGAAQGLPHMAASAQATATSAQPSTAGLLRMPPAAAQPPISASQGQPHAAPSAQAHMAASPAMSHAEPTSPASSGLPRMEQAASGQLPMEGDSSSLPPMEPLDPASFSLPPMQAVAPAPGLPVMEQAAPRAEKPRPQAAPSRSQPSITEVHARPASLWRRLLSFSIDTAAIAGVAALYITLASSVTGVKSPEAGLSGLDGFVAWLRALHTVLLPGVFLVMLLALVYCAVAAFLWNGRTLGRLLLGLRLVDTHGLAPAPGRAIIRAMLSSVSFVLFLGGFWMALFDRRGQTLHDKLTSTFVVQPS